MMAWLRRRFLLAPKLGRVPPESPQPEPPQADASALVIGLIDATVCLGMSLVAAGVLTREQLAENYRTAMAQQQPQPGVDPAARALAVKACGDFFSAPIIGDKPGLRLVVDNDAC
ncbi:MAG TPA: hypothetical protein VHT00_19210 [Stellaceae bacterium]|nr:hypothetical protein [Stellaceae bacterium]HEX3418188.1 hypothetical protein [Stellaceae bacterium]